MKNTKNTNAIKSFRKGVSRTLSALAVTALLVAPQAASARDHDGDNKADLVIYRNTSNAGDAIWLVNATATNFSYDYQWGLAGDIPVQGKYSGGAGADLAVYRPSNGVWYIRSFSADLNFPNLLGQFQWGGLSGDIAQPCDFDGDNRTDLGIFRPETGTWFVRNSNSGAFDTAVSQQWGLPTDTPIAADFDMDGECDYTVFRDGTWFVALSSAVGTSGTVAWGAADDIPVPGLYDSDMIRDFAVFRPSNGIWYIRRSTLAGLTSRQIQFGLPGDIPVPADYTGDGKTDIAVFRPSSGIWFILSSDSNYTTSTSTTFGVSGDNPIGHRRGNQ